jgi:hypothetical protein
MNSIRNWVCVLTAMGIMACALPGLAAPQKTFSLQMVPDPHLDTISLSLQVPVPVTAKIKNLSPTGNSAIDSFTLSVSGATIVGVTQPASGTATFTASSVSVSSMTPLKPGLTFDLNLEISSCGDALWSAVTWTGSNFTGQNFTGNPSTASTKVACGVLACPGDFTVPDSTLPASPIQNDPKYVTGSRGSYNKDGTCGDVFYYVTNTLPLPSNGVLHFRWENVIDPTSTTLPQAFTYKVRGLNSPVSVAWLTLNDAPVFVTAQYCLSPKVLPAPYGTLTADNGDKLTVDTSTPSGNIPIPSANPFVPFPIVIGQERLQVTKISGNNNSTWTVLRGQGGTSQIAHPNVLVMSTPLPLLPTTTQPPPYTSGDQAQMCVAGSGSDAFGSFIQFFDIGDGYVKPII